MHLVICLDFLVFWGSLFWVTSQEGKLVLVVFLFYKNLSGSIIFFSKLPIYFLHHWLPKAHVEVVTCGSAILARLMLKFRIPFLARFWDEVFFRLLVGFFALFSMMNTGDYKVFVAYSSIIHITVFCLGLRLLSTFIFDYYIVPHTLLSARMFWFFGEVYRKKRVRLSSFFRSFLSRSIILLWLGLPLYSNFLAEVLMFSYLFYDFDLMITWLLVFVFYVWVSLKFLRGSLFFTEKEVLPSKNFLMFFTVFCLFWLI